MQNIVMNIFMMRNWRVKLISTSFHWTHPDARERNRRNQIEPGTFANAIRRPLYSVYIPMIYNSKYYDSSSHSQRVLSLHITCGWGQIWMISDSIRFTSRAHPCVLYTFLSRDWAWIFLFSNYRKNIFLQSVQVPFRIYLFKKCMYTYISKRVRYYYV